MAGSINTDLIQERKKCTFNIKELTYLIDGGEEKTKERKEIETKVFAVKELKDEVPEEYLSHKEKYENAIRKAFTLYKVLKEHILARTAIDDYGPSSKLNITWGILKDISPLYVHSAMFLPGIIGQATDEQRAEWLPKALSLKYIGTYAQTELGHGTFVRGLETTATYNPKTEEFILNSPSITAYKWWPGGLAHTANHCILVAQLYTKGESVGVHPFFVQIRDLETHKPLKGVTVGEIGPKLGFSTANNGFLGFKDYRIPRKNMMMRYAQVLKDGTFVKSKSDKLSYGTMVLVRVNIVNEMAYNAARAATVAIRYSAVRHQSKPKEDEPEPQIIDYVTQQQKIFIPLATSHAFRVVGQWLWNSYLRVTKDMSQGNLDALPELHAISCCLKAVSTTDVTKCIEDCRLACGGHGYMASSSFSNLYGITTAAMTYEGDNTVLHLQTTRYLLKSWKSVLEGQPPAVSYLADHNNIKNRQWMNSPEGIINGFQAVVAGKLKDAYEVLQSHLKSGKVYEDAWTLSAIELVKPSEAYCRQVICEVFWSETNKTGSKLSPELATVLNQLAELYIIYWALERTADFLVYSTMTKSDIKVLQRRYEELLALIRSNAVSLVDAFDIRDEILNSTLGAYDGKVYYRLMAEALKSPLNREPVNDSFHKYIKPIVNANL